MTLNTSKADVIAQRRRKVAQLLLRRLTQAEIAATLVNDETGKNYAVSTIARDVKALRLQWREDAMMSIAALKAEQLAEIREARRAAWAAKDLTNWRGIMLMEIKLTGTDAPLEINITTALGDLGYNAEEIIEGYVTYLDTIEPPTGDTPRLTQ